MQKMSFVIFLVVLFFSCACESARKRQLPEAVCGLDVLAKKLESDEMNPCRQSVIHSDRSLDLRGEVFGENSSESHQKGLSSPNDKPLILCAKLIRAKSPLSSSFWSYSFPAYVHPQ